jgi:hypothetical protein
MCAGRLRRPTAPQQDRPRQYGGPRAHRGTAGGHQPVCARGTLHALAGSPHPHPPPHPHPHPHSHPTPLHSINQFAPAARCTHSQVSVHSVLGVHGFDLQRTLAENPSFLAQTDKVTKHDPLVTSVSLDQEAPRHLRTVRGTPRLHPSVGPHPSLGPHPSVGPHPSPHHPCGSPDDTWQVRKGELDLELLQHWINELMREQGHDLFRMKGVLAIAHAQQRYVFHAVHSTFSGSFSEPWGAVPGCDRAAPSLVPPSAVCSPSRVPDLPLAGRAARLQARLHRQAPQRESVHATAFPTERTPLQSCDIRHRLCISRPTPL